MVAFGVVRAALGGELRRMVALGGVCGEGDWLDDFPSLTCFERSVMCGDVLAVSSAHSGGASHASAAAGTIACRESAPGRRGGPMLAAPKRYVSVTGSFPPLPFPISRYTLLQSCFV